jgi:hypothetical protein
MTNRKIEEKVVIAFRQMRFESMLVLRFDQTLRNLF